MWLHVDAAYGGAARLSARDAGRVPDLERADTVTIDPHKWFFQAYDIGGLVVKRREDLLRPSTASPSTTATRARGRAAQLVPVLDRGHAPVPRAEAVDVVEAPRDRGLRAPRRENDDLAAHLVGACTSRASSRSCRSGALGRVLPSPSGGRRWAIRARRVPGPAAAGARGRRDGLGLDDALRGRTYLRAGIVNYLSTDADVDRVLDTLLGAPERVLEQLDVGDCVGQRDAGHVEPDRVRMALAFRQEGFGEPSDFRPLPPATASKPPPNAEPRRVFTSQNTSVPPRARPCRARRAASPVPRDEPVAEVPIRVERACLSHRTGRGPGVRRHDGTLVSAGDTPSATERGLSRG